VTKTDAQNSVAGLSVKADAEKFPTALAEVENVAAAQTAESQTMPRRSTESQYNVTAQF